MELKLNEYQKKVLEKLYLRLVEHGQITEEGRNLCAQANVNP
jgi:hypothetical protein